MANFLGCDADEVVFGPNTTSLTFAMSNAIGRELRPGDEIVLTHLDHDANISPWRALEERGVNVQFADIHEEDCTSDMDDLARKITSRTKIVAAGYASNAVGTINDARAIVRLAHQAGAMAYIDAVHYAPHGPIDVRELDCDFLVCSTYKFFGPHMGVLYGKREHLERLQPYKVRANTNAVPQRWEVGHAESRMHCWDHRMRRLPGGFGKTNLGSDLHCSGTRSPGRPFGRLRAGSRPGLAGGGTCPYAARCPATCLSRHSFA